MPTLCELAEAATEGLLLRTGDGAERWVPYADLGGIALEGDGVTLFVGGSALRLTGATGDTVTRILERACKVPEFTRSSRHLGSPFLPTPPGAKRLLQLLLGARRELATHGHPLAQVRTFDAEGLASAVRGIAAELARDCYPASQPESRALEWRFLEIPGLDTATERTLVNEFLKKQAGSELGQLLDHALSGRPPYANPAEILSFFPEEEQQLAELRDSFLSNRVRTWLEEHDLLTLSTTSLSLIQ